MRRVITTRQPSRLLADCACTSRPLAQATKCLSTFSTNTSRPRVSEPRPAVYNDVQSRTFVKIKRRPIRYAARNGRNEWIPESDPDLDLPELGVDVRIKAPGRMRLAPSPEKIDDETYLPATHAQEMEEVSPVAQWWENEQNWSTAMNYVGFGRREKINDGAVLEAMARRALIETLAVREVEGEQALTGTWITGGRQEMLKALEVDLVVGEDGSVSLKGDVQAVVRGLKPSEVPQESKPVAESERQEDERVVELQDAVAADQEAYSDVLPSEEAHQLRKTWDKRWKAISVEEPRFKFALNKRIQQLTGHIINDAKLMTVRSVGSYLTVLVKPPAPKTLAELVEKKGELPSLPNVKMYSRRVTPIDKEKMVGRWKVIVQELEKRELPVIGTGVYGNTPERKWAMKKADKVEGKKKKR